MRPQLSSTGPSNPWQSGRRQAGEMFLAKEGVAGASSMPAAMRAKAPTARTFGDETMQAEVKFGREAAVRSRPLEELLRCPPSIGNLLNSAARCVDVESGETVFRQSTASRGLYLIVTGQFVRRTERLSSRLLLGTSRPGDLVELAAVLGDGLHTYTLSAQVPGSLLLLPIEELSVAFTSHPPLRMRLLEELAREVSRGYDASCQHRMSRTRRRNSEAARALGLRARMKSG